MISVFPPEETQFSGNGLKILQPLKAMIFKEDNGDYFLDIQDDISMLEFYVSGNILRCDTPWGRQCFRIGDVEVTNRRIKLRAWHLFYDTENFIIIDAFIVEKNCNKALDYLNMAANSPFKTISDVPSVTSYRSQRKTLTEAIKNVLNLWGGHLIRNNWNIEIRANIGQDRGVDLLYGKNIVTMKAEEDWSMVATKIMPVGKDGLMLNETWLENPADLYRIPHTKVVKFDQKNVNPEDFEDASQKVDEARYLEALIDDLRDQGTKYLQRNAEPKLNYVLDAYLKDISDVGDVIWVEHPACKQPMFTTVFSLEFNVISQRIVKVEFRNFTDTKPKNLGNLLDIVNTKITRQVDTSVSNSTANLRRQLTEATQFIRDTLNNSYVIYDGDKILIVDTLPKESAKNVIMINNGGIGFSQNGINGIFNSAWTIDGTLNMQHINVLNLVADLIKGGTLRLGGNDVNFGGNGNFELYDIANTLISRIDKDGIAMINNGVPKVRITAKI